MPFNGSGTFTRVYNWQTDKANSIKIRADRMDGEDDGFATGLTTCITKDGQTTVTANLPMGGFKHTGTAVASSRTDYLRASQLQDNDLTTYTATGTDTYAITPSPAVTSYTTGQSWLVIFTNAGTTAATLNVNSLGAKAITKNGTTALIEGDISAGQAYCCTYDGTRFQIEGAFIGAKSVTSALTLLTLTNAGAGNALDVTGIAKLTNTGATNALDVTGIAKLTNTGATNALDVTGIAKLTNTGATNALDVTGIAKLTNTGATNALEVVGTAKLQAAKEKVYSASVAMTGTINFGLMDQALAIFTSNATANWVLNFRGNTTTALNSIMSVGESMVVTTGVSQAGTAYYNTAIKVDDVAVTPKWQGGTAPTSGNASSVDFYTYTIVKIASASYLAYASQTKFA